MNTNTITALLVDDEARARRSLENLLTRFCPEVKIVSQVACVDEATAHIRKHRPDVVFLDIEMPGKSGFTLISAFEKVDFHVIFVTAYDRYAVKAFEVSAIDYLLKPVDVDRLREAIQKVMMHRRQQEYNSRFEALETNIRSNSLKKLAIPYKNDYAIINIDDIITIKAERMYSIISVPDALKRGLKHYTYSRKLLYFETLFERFPHFLRVHRSWMVNTRYIVSYSRKDYRITLKNGTHIPLGRTYKSAFESLLEL